MDVIAEIRRRFHVDNETATSLSEAFKLSRPTIRKHLNTVEAPVYQRQNQPHPKPVAIQRAKILILFITKSALHNLQFEEV